MLRRAEREVPRDYRPFWSQRTPSSMYHSTRRRLSSSTCSARAWVGPDGSSARAYLTETMGGGEDNSRPCSRIPLLRWSSSLDPAWMMPLSLVWRLRDAPPRGPAPTGSPIAGAAECATWARRPPLPPGPKAVRRRAGTLENCAPPFARITRSGVGQDEGEAVGVSCLPLREIAPRVAP